MPPDLPRLPRQRRRQTSDADSATFAALVGMCFVGFAFLGIVMIVLHSFLYLGYGPRNNILHESFYDNNPAAPCSLLGLVAGMLPLTHQVLLSFGPGDRKSVV